MYALPPLERHKLKMSTFVPKLEPDFDFLSSNLKEWKAAHDFNTE